MNAKKFLTPKRQYEICILYNIGCIIYMYSVLQKIPFFVKKIAKVTHIYMSCSD